MFYYNLKQACKENNISITATLKQIGIGTANGTYWKNGSVPASDIVVKLAEFLNVTTDYLLLGIRESSPISLDDSEQRLLGYFSELSDINKGIVIGEAKLLAEQQQAVPILVPADSDKKESRSYNTVVIDLYTLPASAGTGVNLDNSDTEPLEIEADDLSDTANYYAVRISGDSMEPKYHDEDIVLVESTPSVELGEIGIFILNGEGYIKKLGESCLISLNPKYKEIEFDENDDILCKGKVIGVV